MEKIESRILKTLEYVKKNPLCKSTDLDGYLVNDLVLNGYLAGLDNSSCGTSEEIGYEYEDLKLTMEGEQYLESILSSQKQNPESKWRLEKIWIPILLMLFAFSLGYYIK